ncbi:hypothetical protein GGI12_003573 [Dipsacomyces acuminosporus]|nr:hypothetical protein GGI12_003573 [Dipsacomyces acuminosporus]
MYFDSTHGIQMRLLMAQDELEEYMNYIRYRITDRKQLGSKISTNDYVTIASAIRNTEQWLALNSSRAFPEEIDERRLQLQYMIEPIMYYRVNVMNGRRAKI